MAGVPEEGAVLDRRTLNRTLLARQLLLERAELSPLEAVERLVGMQAQVPLDPYVGLWSRLEEFDPVAAGDELLERRLVRMTLMRTTLHLVSARDGIGMRAVLQETIERAFRSSPFAKNLAGLELGPVLERGVELVEAELLSLAELGAELARDWPGYDASSLAYAFRYLVPLVQVTPRGVWGKALQPKMTTLECWLDRPPAVDASVDELVVRYLRAFGPASVADVHAWSGLGGVREVVERLGCELRVYRDDSGRKLYDVRDGVFCDGDATVPVRFLPQYDNLFLAHADRRRIIGDVRWDASFLSRGAVFVDGFLRGSWKLDREKRDATLAVELRSRVTAEERKDVRRQAGGLFSFLAPGARSRRLELTAR